VAQSDAFYFDKLCQIRMPSWTRGPVALVGDAGYCASPAAGLGGSLAIDGAGALAGTFATCGDDVESAFAEYNRSFRPFVEEVQANAVSFGLDLLLPRTVDVIHDRTEA
jgi:2-polyprenyl-6-methoxyphenol hydroxylase-like FAD-dependent oxidoreductase